jgi:hypothetical protein
MLTNIIDAMALLRPEDKIVKVLSKKYCIAKMQYTNGTYDPIKTIFGLNNNQVTSYPFNFDAVAKLPNIEPQMWCVDGNQSGANMRWKVFYISNRKLKRHCRKIQSLLK